MGKAGTTEQLPKLEAFPQLSGQGGVRGQDGSTGEHPQRGLWSESWEASPQLGLPFSEMALG